MGRSGTHPTVGLRKARRGQSLDLSEIRGEPPPETLTTPAQAPACRTSLFLSPGYKNLVGVSCALRFGGVPLGVVLFQCEEERQTGQNKWTDEQQRELTRQLRYGCGKRREFHNPSIKDLGHSPRDHPPF